MSDGSKVRIRARLTGDAPETRAALVGAAVEHALAQPIASYVDRDSLVALARAAATDANILLLASSHVRPAIDRQKTRSNRIGETVGDLLPHDSEARVLRVLDKTKLPDAAWAKGIVDGKLVNKLVAPVVQQTLMSFTKRLPIPGMGGGGGGLGGALRGGLGGLAGGAGKLLDVGKSVVGGLSAEFEKSMQSVAKDFAENAADEFRDAFAKRLASEEGAKIVREIVIRAHAKIRDVKAADLLAEIDALPAAEVDALVAATIAHNAPRSAVADALRAEIEAALAVDGGMTIGAWLDRAGIRDQVRAVIDARADVVLRRFFESAPFSTFLDALLAD